MKMKRRMNLKQQLEYVRKVGIDNAKTKVCPYARYVVEKEIEQKKLQDK